MKKVFFILIAVVLVSVTATSCKKTCVCYTLGGPRIFDFEPPMESKAGCLTLPYDSVNNFKDVVRCEWEAKPH